MSESNEVRFVVSFNLINSLQVKDCHGKIFDTQVSAESGGEFSEKRYKFGYSYANQDAVRYKPILKENIFTFYEETDGSSLTRFVSSNS